VTEFMAGGTLADALAPPAPPLPWALLAALARGAAEGLAALHARDLLHRDVKADNLLLDDAWRVVLADFGFARSVAGARGGAAEAMTIVGTEACMAPEVLFGEPYGAAADVFALGCVLAHVLARRAPGTGAFLARTPRGKFALDLAELRAASPRSAPPSLVECAAQCLAYEPEERPTAEMAADWLRELEAELAAAEAAEAGEAGRGAGAGAGADDEPPRGRRADVPRPSEILTAARAAAAASSGGGGGSGGGAGGVGGVGGSGGGGVGGAGAHAARE